MVRGPARTGWSSQFVLKLLSIIPEVREQPMCVEIGVFGELVIEGAGEAVPGPVIQIFLNIQSVIEGSLSVRIEVRSGFNVVDRPAVVVIAVSTHEPKAFAMAAVGTETHARAG